MSHERTLRKHAKAHGYILRKEKRGYSLIIEKYNAKLLACDCVTLDQVARFLGLSLELLALAKVANGFGLKLQQSRLSPIDNDEELGEVFYCLINGSRASILSSLEAVSNALDYVHGGGEL
jgi:hypothetical protein